MASMGTRAGAVLAIAVFAAAGCGPETRDPAEPVRRAYEARRSPGAAFEEELPRTFTRRLAALYAAGRGRVGADPLLWTRASGAAVPPDLAVDVLQRSWGRARVRARFTAERPVELHFELRFERGRWLIDDVERDGGSYAAALSRP